MIADREHLPKMFSFRHCRMYCLGNQNTVFPCLIGLNISGEKMPERVKVARNSNFLQKVIIFVCLLVIFVIISTMITIIIICSTTLIIIIGTLFRHKQFLMSREKKEEQVAQIGQCLKEGILYFCIYTSGPPQKSKLLLLLLR